jgi:SAM-dependent methyltransferase
MTNGMRDIVRQGYEAGNYAREFRANGEPSVRERFFLERLLSLSLPHPDIVDLGCGTGAPFGKFLASRGAKLTGIDSCAKHIASARQNIPAGEFVEGDFSEIDLGAGRFDAAVALYAVFHIPRDEHAALFGKVARALKANGLFLVTLGAVASEYGEEENWAGAKMAWSSYDPDRYRKLLAAAGFEIFESQFEGAPGDREYHWWVLARKIV